MLHDSRFNGLAVEPSDKADAAQMLQVLLDHGVLLKICLTTCLVLGEHLAKQLQP